MHAHTHIHHHTHFHQCLHRHTQFFIITFVSHRKYSELKLAISLNTGKFPLFEVRIILKALRHTHTQQAVDQVLLGVCGA